MGVKTINLQKLVNNKHFISTAHVLTYVYECVCMLGEEGRMVVCILNSLPTL